MQKAKQKGIALHHYLIAAELVFRNRGEDAIMSIRMNGVLMTDKQKLPAKSLGKAQQIVQQNFHNKMQDPNIEILDVVLLNMPYLGHMTQEEYEAQPNAPTQEQAAAAVTSLLEGGEKPN